MTRWYRNGACVVALALVCSVPAMAQGWQARGSEAFVRNQAGKSALVIACVQGRSVGLRIQNPTPWRANQGVSVQAGGRVFQMEIEGGSDYVVLSNGPGGISDALITALKGGGALTLQGPAAQRMTSADRTFLLAGAASAISSVERACGRSPAAAVPSPSRASGSGDGPLSAAEVRQQIIGKQLVHVRPDNPDGTPFYYGPGERVESANWNRATGVSGRYRLEADGRVCWSMVVDGCFQYYRRNGVLRVRRSDADSRAEIGTVRFE